MIASHVHEDKGKAGIVEEKVGLKRFVMTSVHCHSVKRYLLSHNDVGYLVNSTTVSSPYHIGLPLM